MAKLERRRKKGAVPSLDEASTNLVKPALREVRYADQGTPAPIQVVHQVAPKVVQAPIPAPVQAQVQTVKELKPMNFKVPPDFKKQYKQFALDNDMSLVEVLKQSFKLFKQQ